MFEECIGPATLIQLRVHRDFMLNVSPAIGLGNRTHFLPRIVRLLAR